MDTKWEVGFKDRGLGHGDFGVINTKGALIVEAPSFEIAEHIVNAHNSTVFAKGSSKVPMLIRWLEGLPAIGKVLWTDLNVVEEWARAEVDFGDMRITTKFDGQLEFGGWK